MNAEQRFDIRVSGRGKLIGFRKEKFVCAGSDALERGDLLEAHIGIGRAAIRQENVERAAVSGEVADAEMRRRDGQSSTYP